MRLTPGKASTVALVTYLQFCAHSVLQDVRIQYCMCREEEGFYKILPANVT